MHPMTVAMGYFSHVFFTCSSPESSCKWEGKPAMHQMVHMQWYEPQGGWCWRKTGSRADSLLGFCCSLPLLGLKVLTEVEDPRREEEGRGKSSERTIYVPKTRNARLQERASISKRPSISAYIRPKRLEETRVSRNARLQANGLLLGVSQSN